MQFLSCKYRGSLPWSRHDKDFGTKKTHYINLHKLFFLRQCDSLAKKFLFFFKSTILFDNKVSSVSWLALPSCVCPSDLLDMIKTSANFHNMRSWAWGRFQSERQTWWELNKKQWAAVRKCKGKRYFSNFASFIHNTKLVNKLIEWLNNS